jgi:spermidine/putrescine transport system substrate-binding protein
VSIGDNVDDAYALAYLATGVKDWTQATDEQFKQASDFLREVHKNVRLYWTDNTEIVQAFTGGEVDLAWAWNDAAVQSVLAGAPIKAKRDTEEGLSTWVCGYVLYKDAPGNIDKAYDFLNAINTPEVAQYLLSDWGYAHANAKSLATVDPAALKEKGYDDVQKFVDRTLFQSPLPAERKTKMIEEFEKIKAGF